MKDDNTDNRPVLEELGEHIKKEITKEFPVGWYEIDKVYVKTSSTRLKDFYFKVEDHHACYNTRDGYPEGVCLGKIFNKKGELLRIVDYDMCFKITSSMMEKCAPLAYNPVEKIHNTIKLVTACGATQTKYSPGLCKAKAYLIKLKDARKAYLLPEGSCPFPDYREFVFTEKTSEEGYRVFEEKKPIA